MIDDQSTDYTLDKVGKELLLMAKHGQQLQELLTTGIEAGFAGHTEFQQVQRSVLGEVRALVYGADSWLE